MKIFVLDPKVWLRGEGSGQSRLLREEDDKMCCQGQRCTMLGFLREEIVEKATISDVVHAFLGDPRCKELLEASDATAYFANDTTNEGDTMTDEARVAQINWDMAKGGSRPRYNFALPTPEHPAMTVYEEGEKQP